MHIDLAVDLHLLFGPASDLLDKTEQGHCRASIAWHSVSKPCHNVGPALGKVTIRDSIIDLTPIANAASGGSEPIRCTAGL